MRRRPKLPRRWVLIVAILGVLGFAWQAGEYSTPQYLTLRSAEREERGRVETLTREIDSLTRLKTLIETDPAWQERIGREQYGMLKAGEIEFTVVRD